ncbi:putative RNA methyltransferase [Streptomyces lomondensis]|uniref:Ubiquinone biosynthesis protein n=1 Tax=Streptomyces lomondensis TaxID=68229 RepID=A0ABQ2XFL1_9ACTN|nr:methyltransferase type 11 [Streptomyces lomondensis]MCF0077520.1 methyltransferase type 11 [Streptomyces lomondensis]GGX14591.1 ubiquinone biosynthesis protein [Streptomyces lomondensis]
MPPLPTGTGHRRPSDRLLTILTCPLCPAGLDRADGALRCPGRHTFDIARHGYVGLLTGHRRAPSADSAEMVRSRAAFLRAGHYDPLARTLAKLATELAPPDATVLDAGAGTGHYLAAVLDALPEALGLGLDSSVPALRAAARAHPRAEAAAWDVWQPWPVRTGCAHLLLNVFAPRNGPEFHRALRPDGALLVVTPTARHLRELHEPLGLLAVDTRKEERLRRTLSPHFQPERTQPLEYAMTLTPEDTTSLVAMTPTAHHLDAAELRRRIAESRTPTRVTASFAVSVYRPRRSGQ